MGRYIREVVHMEVLDRIYESNPNELIAYYKIEQRKDKCKLNININGLKTSDNIVYKVCVVYTDGDTIEAKPICTLNLNDMVVVDNIYTDANNIFDTNKDMSKINGLIVVAKKLDEKIDYVNDTFLKGNNNNRDYNIKSINIHTKEEKQINKDEYGEKEIERNKMKEIKEPKETKESIKVNTQEQEKAQEKEDIKINANEGIVKDSTKHDKNIEKSKKDNSDELLMNEQLQMYDEIFNTYPKMNPFQKNINNINWVRVEISDIMFLPLDTWMLINNTYLVNCYRKFKHLILGRNKEEKKMVLGIPDIYYTKIKVMATLYGFNQFKCCKDVIPISGEYGYWIIETNYD
jgi:hypothetical protein